MKTKFLIGLLIMGILVSGCLEEKQCKKAPDCVGRDCFTAACEDNNCTYSPISDCCGNEKCEYGETYENCAADCPNCDDANECTVDTYDYHEEECVSTPNLDIVCCGNDACQVGETYESCAADCPNCDDDNECTEDSYDYHGQECANELIIPCCGNEICDEDVETYSSCPTDCPDCDDNDELTLDIFDYAAQECENVAIYYFTDDFESGIQDWSFTDAEGTPSTAGWSTTVENGNTVLKGTGHNWATTQREWSNYIFKFRFKRVSGQLHATFRQGHTRYFVNLRQDGAGVELRKTPDVGDIETLKTISFSPGNEWHTMEIRGYDNILNVYIDDVLKIKYKDTEEDAVLSGRAAFETIKGEFLIDDVEIKVVTRSDVTYP